MTAPDISIIDYDINNLKSVTMAFRKLGKTTSIVSSPEEIMEAKCLILPGIGAFGDGMKGLQERNLIEPIKKKVASGTPLLGICLGMQMLFSESEEFGINKGLDLIKGRVIPFKSPKEINAKNYKIPHMGWNEIHKINNWQDSLLRNTKDRMCVYFVHSFYPEVDEKEIVLAKTSYFNQIFPAVVQKNNVVGTQFHPEKSGDVGLEMLREFCTLFGV